MACVNNGNLYDTQICEAKMPPELTGGNSFASKLSKSTWFHVQSVQVLCDVTIVLENCLSCPARKAAKLRSLHGNNYDKGMTVLQGGWSSSKSRAIETLHFVLQSMHRSKDPHPKDPCLSHQRKAVKFLNLKMQKTRKHMNNMNPGPQHTDAHGRGKK